MSKYTLLILISLSLSACVIGPVRSGRIIIDDGRNLLDTTSGQVIFSPPHFPYEKTK